MNDVVAVLCTYIHSLLPSSLSPAGSATPGQRVFGGASRDTTKAIPVAKAQWKAAVVGHS